LAVVVLLEVGKAILNLVYKRIKKERLSSLLFI